MEFEWSEAKWEANIAKHGIDFLRAALIFEGPVLTKRDDRQGYAEDRFVSLGMSDGECFVVVHTHRKGVTRLISAWKGGRSERIRYETGLAARAEAPKG